jgi:hypothetical protein
MKKINVRIFTLAALCLFTATFVKAQTADEGLKLRVIGIGLHAEQYKIANMLSYNYNAYTTTVLVPVNIGQHFRLEPELGIIWMKEAPRDDDEAEGNSSFGFTSGLGMFGMFQKGRVNFYAGLRNMLDIGKSEGMSTYNGEPVIEKYTAMKSGPALGFEFFLINNFSIGGEFGIPFTYAVTKREFPEIAGRDDEKNTDYMVNFESGLFVRAYF